MALQESYGQTDLAHEPARLRRMLQSPNPRDRETAQTLLDQLEREHTRELQQKDFYFRQNQSAQDSSDRDQTRRDIHDENLAARKDNQTARELGLKEAHDTGRAQQLQMMAADPNLGKATQEAAKLELNRIMGLNVAQVAPGGAKGEYGPGGAPKGGAITPPTTSYTAPIDAFKVDQATGVGAGAASPTELRDYQANHSSVDATGLRTTTFPSGGIAKAFDRTTPEGRAKIGAPHDIPNVVEGHTGFRPRIEPSGQQSKGFDASPFSDTVVPNNPAVKDNALAGVAKPVSGYTPPTAAFAPKAKPQAAVAPASNSPAPGPNPTPEGTPYVGPFSELNINAPAVAPAPTPFLPPAVPTPPPVLNPQASNDRQDLLKDTENTFYGGGQAPVPTPTPTPPQPNRVASAAPQPHPMTPQALAYLRLLGLA